MRKIGLQLYTIREALKRDFVGALREVADIGYGGVEFAGEMSGYSPRALRGLLDDLGLSPIGGHVGINALDGDAERILESYAALGARSPVRRLGRCPARPHTSPPRWHRQQRRSPGSPISRHQRM